MKSRSLSTLRNGQIMTFIEEDKTNIKFFATLEIEMKDDVPTGLKCSRVETLKDYKSYH